MPANKQSKPDRDCTGDGMIERSRASRRLLRPLSFGSQPVLNTEHFLFHAGSVKRLALAPDRRMEEATQRSSWRKVAIQRLS